jgi:hypothetical protein
MTFIKLNMRGEEQSKHYLMSLLNSVGLIAGLMFLTRVTVT